MMYCQNPNATTRKLTVAFALIILLIFSGCQKKTDPSITGGTSDPNTAQAPLKAAPTPEANIFIDEAMLAKPFAVIGGVVENVGTERLEKLSVEIELRRRSDGSLEKREVTVEPVELDPGQKGKYSLKVLSDEWSGSRIVSLRSGSRAQEVAFKSMPGAKRPPEKIEGKVVIVKTPSQKKSNGAEFINTPDNPYKVP
jgi:hypothetical protein